MIKLVYLYFTYYIDKVYNINLCIIKITYTFFQFFINNIIMSKELKEFRIKNTRLCTGPTI